MVAPPPPPPQGLEYEYWGSGATEPAEWQGTGAVVGGPCGSRRRPPQPLVRLIMPPHAGPSN